MERKYGVSLNKNLAENFAADYLKTDEGKEFTAQMNREFIDYVILGKELHYLNGEGVDEMLEWPDSVVITEKYTLDEIIERFNPSEDTIAAIKKIQNE